MEAAHITWRPLGRLLVEQGLLTRDELELALTKQHETGQRLGEVIVQCGFVSGPELANALAAQYGIELTTEKGFGTGLRSEIQRRHESDRRRIVHLVPEPASAWEAGEQVQDEHEHDPDRDEVSLLAQLEEQWAKLAAAEESLAQRERELAELKRLHERAPEAAPDPPAEHLVFVQLAERYELLVRDGPPPPPSTPLALPDVADRTFVVAGSRNSPFPHDRRPCVFAQPL